ncbi:MAG: hypothetical protein FWD53_09065, partial [Phycisphaerales bacterium]|nr:hypothetical protein [Phycisphaerales bacterium]
MQLLPRSRTARILLSLVLFACLAVAVDLAWTWHWKQIIVSHDTTRITAPLNPQGYPDYLAALNTQLSQGITPPKNENNAAPLLLQIVGTTQTNLTWQTATHKLLNLPPDPLPPQMITLYQFRQEPRDHDAQMAVIHDMENARNAPWSREANLELAQWIDRNTHALDLLHTAVTRPRYYLPLLNRDGQPAHIGEQFFINLATPRLAAYKELADICTARAMSRLDAGDFDGFHHDLLITARLARLLTQSATLIEYLVALAIDARTFMTAQTAAISGKFNATQITTLLRDLDQLPPFPSPAAQIDTADRYIWLDFICKFAHYGGDDTPEVEFSRKFVPVNFNALLRITNTHYDALMNTIALPTFTQRQLAFEQLSQ